VLPSPHRSAGPASSLLWQFLFLVFSALALVPSPLVEFRYFIVPLALLRIYECGGSVRHQLVHIAFNLLIHASALFVFIAKPFRWPDGSTARFMW
jgi:alpha-1,2-glucosyltransferase